MTAPVTEGHREVWYPVVGCEDNYEVSSRLRVRSLERTIIRVNGWPNKVQERILTPTLVNGHRAVMLTSCGKGRHRSVAALLREAQEVHT